MYEYVPKNLDIDNQIEDVINDWSRFISANCLEDECEIINENIDMMNIKRLANTNDMEDPGNFSCLI